MPSKELTIPVQVLTVGRVGTSVNGNPTYDLGVRLPSGRQVIYHTMTDAACAYSVSNYRPHHRDGYAPVPALITLTRAERVRYITRPDGRDY